MKMVHWSKRKKYFDFWDAGRKTNEFNLISKKWLEKLMVDDDDDDGEPSDARLFSLLAAFERITKDVRDGAMLRDCTSKNKRLWP
jgi:hypothetical protein